MLHKWDNVRVQALNSEGAWITNYAGYVTKLTHDPDRIRRAANPFRPQRCRHAGRVASPIETTEDRAFQTESVGKLDDVATAGGLLFIGATSFDRKFRAFDKRTGALLWETTLPAAGNATPATYAVGGRQFVVIAAGGGKSPDPPGGSYVAFALPPP